MTDSLDTPRTDTPPTCERCGQPMGLTFDRDMWVCGNMMCGIFPDTPAPAAPMSDDKSVWIHALNAGQFQPGDIFGWADDRSPTHFLSGIVEEVDHNSGAVRVRDVQPATVNRQ